MVLKDKIPIANTQMVGTLQQYGVKRIHRIMLSLVFDRIRDVQRLLTRVIMTFRTLRNIRVKQSGPLCVCPLSLASGLLCHIGLQMSVIAHNPRGDFLYGFSKCTAAKAFDVRGSNSPSWQNP